MLKKLFSRLASLGKEPIPSPVLRHVRKAYATGFASIVIGAILAIYFICRGADLTIILFPLAVGLYFLVVGRYLLREASMGLIAELTGTFVQSEKSFLRSWRDCVIALENGTYLAFPLSSKQKDPPAGATVTVYIDHRTPYRDENGIQRFSSAVAFQFQDKTH